MTAYSYIVNVTPIEHGTKETKNFFFASQNKAKNFVNSAMTIRPVWQVNRRGELYAVDAVFTKSIYTIKKEPI